MRPVFFNANGCYGKSCSGRTEFPAATDFLDHMDRLGIERSLVWYLPADEMHQMLGNRRLLQEIDSLRTAKDRLVPAFVVAPTMLYDPSAIEELVHQMETGTVRALRFFQSSVGSFTLRQLEPILDQVSRFKPLLMVPNYMDSAWVNDLLLATGKYPDVTFACMEAAWVHLPMVFDLLRRRKNYVFDTSYLHTRDTIRMVADLFGPEGILFGAGPKCCNGASIAGLIYADIGEEQRNRIAGGNLERILGLKHLEPSPAAKPQSGNGLWSKFIRKERLGVEIIDAHGHIGPVAKWIMPDRTIEEQIPKAVGWMDVTGVSRMFVSGEQALYSDPVSGNAILRDSLSGHTDRFSGYFVFNPYYCDQLTPMLDEYFAGDFFVGFKLLCDYWKVPLTDPGFRPAWEYANRHCLPILIHTWEGPYDTPQLLTEIVKEYPDATFILGHSGGTDRGRGEAERLALDNPNVYLDFCGSFITRKPWEQTMALVGNDRVVFGSDCVLHDLPWELGRLLSLDLPDERIIPLLAGNIKRVLSRMKRG